MYLMTDPNATMPTVSGTRRRVTRSPTKRSAPRLRNDFSEAQPASTNQVVISVGRRNSYIAEATMSGCALLR